MKKVSRQLTVDSRQTAHNEVHVKKIVIMVFVFLLFTVNCSLLTAALAAKWGGVDESVVEKYAKEHGRAARDPFINTDQGDLLLFVFLLGGAAGGFMAGYYWRELMERKPGDSEQRSDTGASRRGNSRIGSP